MNTYDLNLKDTKLTIIEKIQYRNHVITKNEFGQMFVQKENQPMIFCRDYAECMSLINYWEGE